MGASLTDQYLFDSDLYSVVLKSLPLSDTRCLYCKMSVADFLLNIFISIAVKLIDEKVIVLPIEIKPSLRYVPCAGSTNIVWHKKSILITVRKKVCSFN